MQLRKQTEGNKHEKRNTYSHTKKTYKHTLSHVQI